MVLNDEYYVDNLYDYHELGIKNYDQLEKYFRENQISKEDTWARIFDEDVLATEEINQVTTGKVALDELTVEGYYRVTKKGIFKID